MHPSELEQLREENRALRLEIERYRIQCVRISDLERMLEVQDRQLEHAQRALRILEVKQHEQQG
jgi:cell shape-determining protein MreC